MRYNRIIQIWTLILLSIVVSINCCDAQQSMEWEYERHEFAGILSLYETSNGELIAISGPGMKDISIQKLSKDGELLQQTIYTNDSMRVEMHRIVWIPSKNYYIILGSGTFLESNTIRRRHFLTFVLNEDLKIIKTNRYYQNVNGQLFNMNYFLTDDEMILSSVNVYNETMGHDSEQLFFKIDNTGDVIDSQYDIGFNCYSILDDEDGYKCIGLNVKYFDNNFKMVSKSNDLKFISPTNTHRAIRIKKDRILLGTNQFFDYDLPKDLGLYNTVALLYYLDDSLKILKKNWIKTDLGSYTFPGGAIDLSQDSSIFIATCQTAFSQSLSFSVAKFDINLNQKWQIRIDDPELYRYRLWGLEATNDNGVVLYGSRYSRPDSKGYSYMVKFNSEGNITWTNDIGADLMTIKSFPNPSSGILNMDIQGIKGSVDIRMFDMTGHNVYVQHGVSIGETTMDLSQLPTGMYVYKVYQGSNEISHGKWVKIE